MAEYLIIPTAKPRMTKRDKWKKRPCVMKYFAFRDRARDLEIMIPNGAHITFYITPPHSWSKKTKAAVQGTPHKKTPDLDNLIKGLFDAVFKDDSHIWKFTAEKRWREKPGIKIEVLA